MKFEWKILSKGIPSFGIGPELGLFADGILAASWTTHDETCTVSVHKGGDSRIDHQIVVSDAETAKRVCLEIAGAPTTTIPQYMLDAFTDDEALISEPGAEG